MREQDRAAARLPIHALQDVLEERVVGAALRRRAQEVPAPRVGHPSLAVPLLDGVRRVREDHVEGL